MTSALTKSVLFTLIIVLTCSCMTTRLAPPKLDPSIQRLMQNINKKRLSLEVKADISSQALGYQYLLILIPFGIIDAPVEKLVENVLSEQLALLGITAELAENNYVNNLPRLRVRIRDLRISAFDFLFTRRIRTLVELEASLFDRTGRLKRRANDYSKLSAFKLFAYKPALEYQMNKNLRNSTKKILLQIFNPY